VNAFPQPGFATRIAVTGVSRTPQGHGSNVVYQRQRDRGYQAFAINPNSVCQAVTEYGRRHGITVIDGGCPLMFDPTADLGHKAMRFVFTRTGKVPTRV
jgi:hypothetical protein